MTDVYATGSFGTQSAQFRGHLNYSVSSSSTTTTVSWKLYLQGRHNYGYTFKTSISGAASKSLSGKLSSNPGSTWTTITSSSGTASFSRGTSAATKTFTLKAVGPKEGQYSGEQTITKTSSFTVPALASYAVTYNGNEATSGSSPGNQTKYYGVNLTLRSNSNNWAKSGYTFIGWGTSASQTSVSYNTGATYTANAALTLYALWRKTITLTYDANGGTGEPTQASANVYNKTTSTTFKLSESIPTRENYNFLGWATSDSATTPDYLPGATTAAISTDTTLYAVWEEAYTPPIIDANTLANVRVTPQPGETPPYEEDDTGLYLGLGFDWEINQEYASYVTGITVQARPTDAEETDPWVLIATTETVANTYKLPLPASTEKSGTIEEGPVGYGAGTFALDKSYNLLITVTDDTTGAGTATDVLSTAFFTMDFLHGGHGVAIGAPHSGTEDTFEVSMDMKVAGNLMVSSMAGMVQMFAGPVPPNGWLVCDGSEVERSEYPLLFAAIGTTYGSGDGSATFNLPDLRGRVPVGVGTGTATGATAHTLGQKAGNENAIVPYHRHGNNTSGAEFTSIKIQSGRAGRLSVASGSARYVYGSNTSYDDLTSSGYVAYAGTSGNTTGANMQPYLAVNYIICTGQFPSV